jgi:hypothetical protein
MEPCTVSSIGLVRLDRRRYVHPVERGVDDLLVGAHQIVFVDHTMDGGLFKAISHFQAQMAAFQSEAICTVISGLLQCCRALHGVYVAIPLNIVGS